MIGARPSDSSSMMSSFGSAMNAIASASICCSPPEMSPARWSRWSRSRGKRCSISSRAAVTRASSSLNSHEAARKCSATVSVGNTAFPPGTCTIPSCAPVTGSAWVMSRPSKKMRPPTGSTTPAMARNSVDLPAPFVPSRATISPSCTSMFDPEEHLHTVVRHVDVAAEQQRARACLQAGAAQLGGESQVLERPVGVVGHEAVRGPEDQPADDPVADRGRDAPPDPVHVGDTDDGDDDEEQPGPEQDEHGAERERQGAHACR